MGIDPSTAGDLGRDFYDYAHRVDGIVDFLGEAALPFVLAVEGEWGRGKSTLVNMIVRKAVPRWSVAKFHPWRYDFQEWDDVWHGVVEALAEGFDEEHKSEISVLLARSRRSSFFDDIREAIVVAARKQRVLLVIDDLDRCSPPVIGYVLRCIPTLFARTDRGPRVAVLLALDRAVTQEAIVVAQRLKDPQQAEAYLEKLIQAHVTLPILQLGSGDRDAAMQKIYEAITGGGHRSEIRRDRVEVIARFMRYNPRKIERFCLLFDLKWKTRFEANRAHAPSDAQQWLDGFRDRLIWEAIVELRWPTYDAKPGDLEANRKAIHSAISGPVDVTGLSCQPFIEDKDFLEIHRIYWDEWGHWRE